MRAVVGAWLMASGYMRRAGARTGVMPPGRGQADIVINIIIISVKIRTGVIPGSCLKCLLMASGHMRRAGAPGSSLQCGRAGAVALVIALSCWPPARTGVILQQIPGSWLMSITP